MVESSQQFFPREPEFHKNVIYRASIVLRIVGLPIS